MKRWHLVELHELKWFPPVWRDLLTDFMSFFAQRFRPYTAIADKLHEVIVRCGEEAILDLCSGAAAPVLTVQEELARRGIQVAVTVSDLYPNHQAFRRLAAAPHRRLTCLLQPTDAAAIPNELPGLRTFFSAFHHFPPARATEILRGVVMQRRGVAVFEYTERSLRRWGPMLLAMPALVWLATPLIRPRRLARWLWTYLLPVVPLVATWDALISVLRSYHPEELLALARSADPDGYEWESGRVRAFGGWRVTYLVGVPKQPAPMPATVSPTE